jgi:UPF0271 protein
VTLDLNVDVGELNGEETLYTLVTSVNVACGGHAGDVASMSDAVRLAASHGVCVGAHPGYPDREHFGRRSIALARPELIRCLIEQVQALSRVCRTEAVPLVHVKPHGALYHDASAQEAVAQAVADAVAQVDGNLALVGFAGSPTLSAWTVRGFRVRREGFADRVYEADGTLRARRHPTPDPRSARARSSPRLALRPGRHPVRARHAGRGHDPARGAPRALRTASKRRAGTQAAK